MDVVKRKRSKGGFLNLFDWPGKSRKRLFSNSSEISEEPRQGRENVQNSSTPIEVDEIGKSSVHNLRSDASCCASSVTSDDGNGGRAPSVVAKLMGLESLPVPNLDPFFLRSSRSANTWEGYKNSGHVNLCGDVDGVPRCCTDARKVKGHNRPIERFQTETLPPRSAKTISVTHNRLLSPIRSPGFVPSKNPAYVMEAASRMIEPGSQLVVTRTRVSPVGSSSSVPLRIRDLKQKLESASKAPNPQNLREKRNEKKGVASSATPATSKISGKVNPSSLSAQAKASIRKQDGSMPSNGYKRISTGQKGNAEAKNRVVKSQNDDRKTVLKQNHQKQNCRDRNQAAKASVPKQQSKRVMNRVVSKVLVESEIGSVSLCSPPSSLTEKDVSLPLSQKKNLWNKKSLNRVQEPRISNDMQFRRGENSIKCNVTIDNDSISGKDDKKKDMDVISFTFSSPIKGISPSATSRSSAQGIERYKDSAVSFNVIDGDYLNVLLEQKLKELTSKIESSGCSLIHEDSLGSTSKNGVNLMISSSSKGEKSIQTGMVKGLSENESAPNCASLYDNRKIQMIQSEEQEMSSISTLTDADDTGCNWSCSDCKDKTADHDGTKQCSSDQELTWVSSSEPHRSEDETEFSESVAALAFSEAKERPNWEVDYITEVLSSSQLMLKEFALGMARDVLLLPASLFHETESREDPMAKIERKMLFDCINQWITLKCEGVFTGSCKGIVGKEGILWERRDWLAEELKREIEGLKKMQEMMVDELVEKDMSSCEGRWLDFEKEAYEEGIEIEREIVSGLVDDLVDDLLSVF
ncbi:PREDICTED: uncharacterized protein LOC104821738 [Tarenaya hassleriana]|uniref:uncharacterized protein LOC104821738 n=1 Tax=Tarenaya hassleriana TaxID=28532 RepID=UPI00053C6650|nr:PREDICTED: uncharacterized protein LOC104821738 [Tarenaya hassleriana]XP_010551009.1 PREDICTED: uncharacterized protein LOC104821738 [Tarenaya hassleriana]